MFAVCHIYCVENWLHLRNFKDTLKASTLRDLGSSGSGIIARYEQVHSVISARFNLFVYWLLACAFQMVCYAWFSVTYWYELIGHGTILTATRHKEFTLAQRERTLPRPLRSIQATQ